MDKKKLMLLMGALVVAIGTALAARSLIAGGSAPQAEAAQQVPRGPKVLVANRALPVGTIITPDAIGYQQWPKEMVQDAYFIEGEADMQKLLGTVVRLPITAGEPVTQGALVAPGDRGFLAAALSPGMRAVTLQTSEKAGVAGFIFPGDRVDVMLTQTVKGDEGLPLKTTETVLRNIRVLATDQQTDKVTDPQGKTQVRAFSSVTVEVPPRIAEKLAVAETLGTLSLALRSISDNQSELERSIASGAVKVPAGASKEEEEKILQAAMARPGEGASTFVTGGDVSRFARRSVPRMAPPPPTGAMGPGAAQPPASGGFGAPPPPPSGPVVRVTRGKSTVDVQLSGK